MGGVLLPRTVLVPLGVRDPGLDEVHEQVVEGEEGVAEQESEVTAETGQQRVHVIDDKLSLDADILVLEVKADKQLGILIRGQRFGVVGDDPIPMESINNGQSLNT